jgi:transposase-like protein
MSKRSRRNHTPAFRAKVVLAALKGDKTLSELATQFDVHPTQITQWKAQLLERTAEVFEGGSQAAESPVDPKALHAKIGELALDWRTIFRGHAQQSGLAERKAMIGRTHQLPVSRQAELLNISRGTVVTCRNL